MTCWRAWPPRLTAGLTPVKVNAVLMRGINDHEAAALLRFCLDHGYQLRFIEQMPLDAQHGWRRDEMVTADEILAALVRRVHASRLPIRPSAARRPAETFLVDGGPQTVGIIGSVTRPFCGACDRVRLTADGQLRNCLFARAESDLRTPLRAGASDDELAARGSAASRPSCPATASMIPASCSPPGPCRPSAADTRGGRWLAAGTGAGSFDGVILAGGGSGPAWAARTSPA